MLLLSDHASFLAIRSSTSLSVDATMRLAADGYVRFAELARPGVFYAFRDYKDQVLSQKDIIR